MTAIRLGPPAKQGLYDPKFEHDACGVGFIVDIKGRKSNAIVKQGIQILKNLDGTTVRRERLSGIAAAREQVAGSPQRLRQVAARLCVRWCYAGQLLG